uniref:nucleoporin Nup43 n=1 Tax=Ciona intestinalis TaxID=7719 RepID=UPI00005237E0|nr:nucleoporin Nup43 [Ciona intestinalis]|eukprot:XP_002127557.1 nucleoporin Nup43 [Ciona intestinalis]
MSESLIFVSQKMSRVRWKPNSTSLQKSSVFAAGSYEDTKNSVSLWEITQTNKLKNNPEMEDIDNGQPRKFSSYAVKGDVSGLDYADSSLIVAGTSCGDILLFNSSESLVLQHEWNRLHGRGGCTDVATSLPGIVSVGEDGNINLMRIESKRPLRVIEHGDSCPITSVRYLTSSEIVTTNTVGQLRMWDTRSPSDSPTRIMVSSDQLVALRSVDHHATQSHVLATGGADGCVTLFDIRKECAPVNKLQVHDEDVWEVRFHKTSPSHLFTCSQDGSARRLDSTFDLKVMARDGGGSAPEVSEVVSKCGLSINSLDVSGSSLVCCNDAEAIYVIEDAV